MEASRSQPAVTLVPKICLRRLVLFFSFFRFPGFAAGYKLDHEFLLAPSSFILLQSHITLVSLRSSPYVKLYRIIVAYWYYAATHANCTLSLVVNNAASLLFSQISHTAPKWTARHMCTHDVCTVVKMGRIDMEVRAFHSTDSPFRGESPPS